MFIDPSLFAPKDVHLLMANSDLKDPETRKIALEVYTFYRDSGINAYAPLWDDEFKNEKIPSRNDKPWGAFLAEHVDSCPNVDAHFVKASKDSPNEERKKKKEEEKVVGLLDQNRDFPLYTVFCGKPVIRVTGVKEVVGEKETKNWNSAQSQLSGFCDGAPACTYGAKWLNEFSSALSNDRYYHKTDFKQIKIRVHWSCVTCEGEKPHSKDFMPDKLNSIDFDCAESQSKKKH